ncbi:MAG: sigma-70 family RNA polymerase sigma factor [Oscillospiraceae bacterium]|nr:sigma-70 family RNA polymerase sigma factor [Oscillospiraceae bacterium]
MDPFAELYETYQPDIYRFLLCLSGGDALAAEELTQECFYQAFLSFGRFRGECTVRTWLCQIAKNVYGKYIRRESRQRRIAEQQTMLPEKTASVTEEAEQREQFRAIRAALETLGEPMRTVAEYRLGCGLSYAEIAGLTGVRPETAAVMCSRARQKLRKILREEYGYEI